MPVPSLDTATASAYALEASTWLALEGHIPGHPMHDPAAWAAWRAALHAALQVASCEDTMRVPPRLARPRRPVES